MAFQDHFSDQASEYASFRPAYPDAVGEYLAGVSPHRHRVWEVGCGSGQFSKLLSAYFDEVIATDSSAEQLAQAPPLSNVVYLRVSAEDSGLKSGTADLTVAAQAAHWFDIEVFYREVRRVGRTDSMLALMTYDLLRIDDRIDAIIKHFYETDLATYWTPERRHVESGYRSLPFPFEELKAPAFDLRAEWLLPQVLGYIETWSGVRALLRGGGRDVLEAFRVRLSAEWGNPTEVRTVRWPLFMRLGRL